MSTSRTLGLMHNPVPVTAASLLPFALLDIYIIYRVLVARHQTKTYFGCEMAQTSNAPKEKPLSGKSPITDFDPMAIAARTHANFAENVPLALIFAAVVELAGGSRLPLGLTLGSLWVARLAHVVGLKVNSQPLRAAGFMGTSAILLGLGGWASWLGFQALM